MKIGIIGHGMVGSTLSQWLTVNTHHEIKIRDTKKEKQDSFDDIQASFICIPINNSYGDQDHSQLQDAITFSRFYTDKVFIRSTVLPGTNDKLKTISMPEFFTARTCHEDMKKLPIICGDTELDFIKEIFPEKEIIMMKNKECELAKYCHNLFGAMKVTYFNMVYKLAEKNECSFDQIKHAMFQTGFIEKTHTQVPGPDGQFGFGGACFPDNIETFAYYLRSNKFSFEHYFFNSIKNLNKIYRNQINLGDL